jgi:hypothetical protein
MAKYMEVVYAQFKNRGRTDDCVLAWGYASGESTKSASLLCIPQGFFGDIRYLRFSPPASQWPILKENKSTMPGILEGIY